MLTHTSRLLHFLALVAVASWLWTVSSELVSGPLAADDEERVFGSIDGTVSTTDGVPLLGAEVRLDPLVTKSVVTDAEGRFTLRRVPEGSYEVVIASPGFAIARTAVEVSAGAAAPTLEVVLAPAEVTLDSINVVGSYSLGRDAPASTVALSAEELLELPHFGDDIVRAVTVLPGVTSNDASAEFNVRGGLTREVRYEIDGLEIFEPYHLKDFQGIFSIIDPDVLAGVDLYTGGFPAEYGDRSAGVLDLETFSPSSSAYEVGISLLNAWGSASGTLDSGSWFVSARRGWLDLVLDIVGDEDEEGEVSRGSGPEYWDLIGKAAFDLGPSQDLTIQALLSSDTNDEFEREFEDGFFEEEQTDSSYGNDYLWARHNVLLGSNAFLESMAAIGQVDRDRLATEEGPERNFTISDVRALDILQGRQDLNWQLDDSLYLKAGWDARRYEAEYQYRNELFDIDSVGDALGVERITEFAGDFESDTLGLYLSSRWQVTPRFVVEAGARWDDYSLTDENHVSPRVNGLVELGDGWRARFAWGLFHQSQRPNELQVEDGEVQFFPAEQAEHRILGLERTFDTDGGLWDLKVEAYQRVMDDLRPRYENAFQLFVLNPETANDRILIAPTAAEARGAEIFLARRGGGKLDWWINYAWSEAEDTIDGRDVPRVSDQTHAVNLSLGWRPTPRWSFNAVFIYHTGWPTTPVSAGLGVDDEGRPIAVPVIGELRSDRLDDYHRLDVRASRRVPLRGSVLELFVDVQNLYNNENDAGFEVNGLNFFLDDQGAPVYEPSPETWLGIIPSFGISWTF
ncbi:MAG: TonB-dependent receptor [Acidobacteriota bacterium]